MARQDSIFRVAKIISGGQTGVDRGALDAALELGIPHGGWCPLGRRAEDGVIDPRYQLSEDDSPRYESRTERNVVESDATLVFHRGPYTGGTSLTIRLAKSFGRPCLTVDLGSQPSIAEIRDWLRRHHVQILNVAGPRESQQPGIGRETVGIVRGLFL